MNVIYGNGKTGVALKSFLNSQNKTAVIFDDDLSKTEIGEDEISFDSESLLLLSPGVKPTQTLISRAKESGALVLGELAYCSRFVKAPMVSVTGTNGKTTVCGLVHHILNCCNMPSELLGNGGVPLSTNVETQKIVVHESSSFQLADCNVFDPYLSVLVSLDEDHTDYHGSYENYVEAKCNNFAHQSTNHFAVFNADDKNVMELADKCRAYTYFYSVNNHYANCYLENDECVVNIGKVFRQKCDFSKYSLCNKSNILCALLVTALLGADCSDALKAVKSFVFYKHRYELVRFYNGVRFVDDSKATNIHATLSALNNSSEETALILGGFDKGYGFDYLFENLPKHVSFIAVCGDTADKILQSATKYGFKSIVHCQTLGEAVDNCYDYLKKRGGVLLMSNACSSFDKYGSYAERGDAFKKCVEALQ